MKTHYKSSIRKKENTDSAKGKMLFEKKNW